MGRPPESEFDAVYLANARRLLAFVAARVPDRHLAEDICQEVWMRFAEQKIRGIASPVAWLNRVAVNLVIDAARRPKAELSVIDHATLSPDIGSGWDTERIAHCLEKLAKVFPRAADIIRQWLGGVKIRDVAQALRLSAEDCSRQKHEALKQLKTCYVGSALADGIGASG